MMVMFTWASWNGATYYIDVFGRRMEKELEQLRKDIARLSKSPDITGQDGGGIAFSPLGSPAGASQGMEGGIGKTSALDLGPSAQDSSASSHRRNKSEDDVSSIDGQLGGEGSTLGMTDINGSTLVNGEDGLVGKKDE